MGYFGTNGIREVVGTKVTARFIADMTTAIAEVHGGVGPAVVGTDARTSSPALGRVAAGALSMAGIDVIELGILPTPAIQYNVPRLGAAYGVVITASHNPPEFNGIKGIASDGLEFTREIEQRVEAAYEVGKSPSVPYDRIGTISSDPNGGARYVEGILSHVKADAIRKRRLKVLLDCGNGAASITSPTLLHRLGAQYFTLNATMDGTFPAHHSEPTEANIQSLIRSVKSVGAELGAVHDGDADRSIFVDEGGRYIPGEKILTLLAREIIKAQGGGVVITPVTSSDSVAEAIKPYGGSVIYTRVGSPVVSRIMKEKQGVLGGEENGGIILAEHQIARDGAMTLAKIMEILSLSGQPLSELVRSLPPYHLVKEKVRCPVPLRGKLLDALPGILDAKDGAEVTTLDGVKVRTATGWVLVRPSGTEPICRIFAESRDPSHATELARSTSKKVEELVRSLEAELKGKP